MITKTYLEGKLSQLEENLKKRIELRESRQSQEAGAEIKSIKDKIGLVEEKVTESKDILHNYLLEHNNLKIRLEELEMRIKNLEENIPEEE